MLAAFAKAVGQLGEKSIRRYVWISLGIAILVFALLWLVVGVLLTETAIFQSGWLETAVDVLGGLATLVITWVLFPAVVSSTIGFFLDGVAGAVERRHYPGLPPARDVPIGETVVTSIKFLTILVALNLLVLVFLVVPPVFPFVFYAVNAYLLGREYFELVALRRVDASTMRSLRRRYRAPLFLAGLAAALLLTIPIINLLTPVIATAATVHLFEGWRKRTG